MAETCTKFFIPYIKQWHEVAPGMNILEVGCGEGGNLLPFAKAGCNVTGVDIAPGRIEEARRFFREKQAKGRFIAEDFLKIKGLKHQYDIVICHDVLEHVYDKDVLLSHIGYSL